MITVYGIETRKYFHFPLLVGYSWNDMITVYGIETGKTLFLS